MANSIRSVLSPLLSISYVCGMRIVEFPSRYRRQWFGLLYMLLLWSVYIFFVIYRIMSYLNYHSKIYVISFLVNNVLTLISVILGVYRDKKFRKCLKKLDIVDNTLKQLGITTDYEKLYARIIWLIFGWLIIIIISIYCEADWLRYEYGHDIITAIYVPFLLMYCLNINVIEDILIVTLLGYIGLKFDQINENFQNITRNNKLENKHFYENIVLHSRQRSLKAISSKFITWIVIHLHLELQKLSHEINTIFGKQMTVKMALYFGFIAVTLREIINLIFIHNYVHNETTYIFLMLLYIILNSCKLFFINYMCEKVSVKANKIGNLVNRISYSTYDIEVRENISQLLLHMTQAPFRFSGIGLFQFGFKYFYQFSKSLTTVLILLIQPFTNK
ncbi:uncharacterized protein [Linepithema humile]|uniref:uncharacterized protein n=1 Tax=Linepithema humile TaxID=83485 RepID=UPI00351DE218